jgi:type I restriction enzyme S subunit
MKNEKLRVPKLRFKEFSGEWEEKYFGDIYSFLQTNSFSRALLNYKDGDVKNIHYGDIHTKFKSNFYIQDETVPYINQDVDLSKIKEENYCKEKDLVIADASEDYKDIGKAIELIDLNNEKLLAGLHTYIARDDKDKMALGFSGYFMQTHNVRVQMMKMATGISVLGISKGNLNKLELTIPQKQEQEKIASFLSSIDKKINQLSKKDELLQNYKKAMMQKIFSQKLRFKKADGSDYPKWEEFRLKEVLDYEQPTKYIVKSTEYCDSYDIPVLTAGKTFILGYTNEKQGIYSKSPVIIFDDFTTANHYVDFDFKIKSSAMKLLKEKNKNINLKFVYEFIQRLHFPLGEHKRYWISEYSYLKIKLPCLEEQTKIANFLLSLDIKISQNKKVLEETQKFKKALLNQMFI